MTSRDGVLFRRWSEELIPITAPKDRDGNRSNYMTWGLLQLPGNDRELSVYATEAYYAGPGQPRAPLHLSHGRLRVSACDSRRHGHYPMADVHRSEVVAEHRQ